MTSFRIQQMVNFNLKSISNYEAVLLLSTYPRSSQRTRSSTLILQTSIESNFSYHFWMKLQGSIYPCIFLSIPKGKINTENMLNQCLSMHMQSIGITQKCAIMFTSIVFSTSESGESINLFPVTIPALLTTMLTSPTSFLT